MKVAFHLRRVAAIQPAKALLVPSHAVGDVLKLCARLGFDPVPPIYAIAEGFLIILDKPVTDGYPPAIRLREVVPQLLIPADAELVPALLDDEAEGLVSQRGLVFLPGGRVLGFEPNRPVPLSALVSVDGVRRRDWRALPAPRPRAERIEE